MSARIFRAVSGLMMARTKKSLSGPPSSQVPGKICPAKTDGVEVSRQRASGSRNCLAIESGSSILVAIKSGSFRDGGIFPFPRPYKGRAENGIPPVFR
jgi:hypothetical protein